MKPDKILFVDDEAMALKYFERLVSPLAPVITAPSVEEGKAILRAASPLYKADQIVRPLLIVLTLPVTVLTLGLFLFVINALTFQMASGLLDGLQVTSFWSALLGSLLYSVWSLIIDVALQRVFVRRAAP